MLQQVKLNMKSYFLKPKQLWHRCLLTNWRKICFLTDYSVISYISTCAYIGIRINQDMSVEIHYLSMRHKGKRWRQMNSMRFYFFFLATGLQPHRWVHSDPASTGDHGGGLLEDGLGQQQLGDRPALTGGRGGEKRAGVYSVGVVSRRRGERGDLPQQLNFTIQCVKMGK